MSPLEDSWHPTTRAAGQRCIEGFPRGMSQGSSLSLPSAQKRLAMASRSGAGRLRNQPGISAVNSISSSVKLQSDVSKTGRSWRWTTWTSSAPSSASRAAHDEDPLPAQPFEVDQRAGVRPAIGRKGLPHPIRDHREVRYAGRGDDGVRDDAPAALEDRLEAPVGLPEISDQVGYHLYAGLPLEPLGVVEEEPDRDGLEVVWVQATLFEVGHERVLSGGIQVPVGARAQHHPARHVLAPEGHRLADDELLDAGALGARGSGQAVRSGPDHQERRVDPVFSLAHSVTGS